MNKLKIGTALLCAGLVCGGVGTSVSASSDVMTNEQTARAELKYSRKKNIPANMRKKWYCTENGYTHKISMTAKTLNKEGMKFKLTTSSSIFGTTKFNVSKVSGQGIKKNVYGVGTTYWSLLYRVVTLRVHGVKQKMLIESGTGTAGGARWFAMYTQKKQKNQYASYDSASGPYSAMKKVQKLNKKYFG
ncbi:hypothetical protein EQG49_04985 [Periweissella cryptocerci]|uniref:Uncharacterized protein n=1 Tax=Periweissella cryptocerci TaxID=2506420 RepID=A0A4P6YT04_9LACO|nr:hypothetical protein [Periweissella cryptocerci]QBO35864.1 hypothetical protein EQG49_04985 [Periweissella cryptocerci]